MAKLREGEPVSDVFVQITGDHVALKTVTTQYDSAEGDPVEIRNQLLKDTGKEDLLEYLSVGFEAGAILYGARTFLSGIRHKNLGNIARGTAVWAGVALFEKFSKPVLGPGDFLSAKADAITDALKNPNGKGSTMV